MAEERTGPVAFSPRVIQYGKAEPLPRRQVLRAGPLTAVLEGGDLRYITLGNEVIVLRLYAAIRDRNWGTIEPVYRDYEVEAGEEGFTVRFLAENAGNGVDFAWRGEITGTSDGVITATMDGEAKADFLKNRIGWCVLHPMTLAGMSAVTETPDGEVAGAFPDLISPHQPFIDMQSIAHGTPDGGEVILRFEGDLFEMEDQRNWTDASYKTYSTPLRDPYPVEIKQGDRVWQKVTIETTGNRAKSPDTSIPIEVTVDTLNPQPLPPIGLVAAGHGSTLAEEDVALLREVRPSHLRVVLHLAKDDWRDRLSLAAEQAQALEAALEIEAIAGEDGAGLADLAEALQGSGATVARLLVFPDSGIDTTGEVLAAARAALTEAGVSAPVGGGTRAYFTELNRATLPLAGMDVVGYTINPQVHAFDNASLTETLAAQGETVRSARAIVGERPLAIGPVTLSPRFNPNATGEQPPTEPGQLPPSVDYRQPSLFAAAWLAGSVNALGNAGADSLTYFETTGWKGLIERRDHPLRIPSFHSWLGMVFPAYHVLADIGAFRGGQIMPVTVSDPLRVQGLALRDGSRARVILANMSDEPVRVSLALPGATDVTVRPLDTDSALMAATDPAAFRASARPAAATAGTFAIDLSPNGLATLDAELPPA